MIETGPAVEICSYVAGTDTDDPHTPWFHFGGETSRVRRHVRLRRRIRRGLLHGCECRDARHDDEHTRTAGHHGRHDNFAQSHDTGRHEIRKSVEVIAVARADSRRMGHAGIRHEDVDLTRLCTERLDPISRRQVGNDDLRRGAEIGCRHRNSCERNFVSPDENDVVAETCMVESKCFADARRGTRDHDSPSLPASLFSAHRHTICRCTFADVRSQAVNWMPTIAPPPALSST